MAWRRLSFRAAAKSSTQAKSWTLAPSCLATARVSSTEPVSTTMISSDEVGDRGQTPRQGERFVPGDHAERHPHAHLVLGSPCEGVL